MQLIIILRRHETECTRSYIAVLSTLGLTAECPPFLANLFTTPQEIKFA